MLIYTLVDYTLNLQILCCFNKQSICNIVPNLVFKKSVAAKPAIKMLLLP